MFYVGVLHHLPTLLDLRRVNDQQALALHGFSCLFPQSWEIVASRGNWERGHVVLAEHPLPKLNLTWQRSKRAFDIQRTQNTLRKRIAKETGATAVKEEACANRGILMRYHGEQTGQFHSLIIQPNPDQGLLLIFRQLSQASADDLRDLAQTIQTRMTAPLFPWRLHKLEADLSPYWRLQGMNAFVGMTRAVWFYQKKLGDTTEQILVLRRYAIPDQVLGKQSLSAWTKERLHKKETVVAERQDDNVYVCCIEAPGRTWWRRLRGRGERKVIQAWYDHDQRLMIQEWRGDGAPPQAFTNCDPQVLTWPQEHPLLQLPSPWSDHAACTSFEQKSVISATLVSSPSTHSPGVTA